MGYIRHNAIVITSMNEKSIRRAHRKALNIFWCTRVSAITSEQVNGVRSFFIAPDGSKEGWIESDEGDEQRAKFRGYLHTQTFEDGSSNLKWCEIQYGDDNSVTCIIDDSDAARRAKGK